MKSIYITFVIFSILFFGLNVKKYNDIVDNTALETKYYNLDNIRFSKPEEPVDLGPYNNYINYLRNARPKKLNRRLPIVQTVYGKIDLQTYHRNCDCKMCIYLRDLQKQYLDQYDLQEAAQMPTSPDIIDEMVNLLDLNSDDLFADFGSGDGRILIAISKRFNCRCVGIELDPYKVQESRDNIRRFGLEDKIKIIQGDVLSVDLSNYNIKAASAYLYPELLEKIKGKLLLTDIVVTPYHNINGVNMEKYNNIYIYKKDKFRI